MKDIKAGFARLALRGYDLLTDAVMPQGISMASVCPCR